ncbi:MAG: Pr6Pr family membrane protein [Bacteroidota bacterium]
MHKQPDKGRQIYAALVAILGWLAVALQFYLIIDNRATTVPETVIRFFSFFTILTNILVAWCFTNQWLKANEDGTRFFARPTTLTAVTVYITLVGLVYNLLLRFLWHPQGLQRIVDELLHSVIPVLVVLYWGIFVPKSDLKWKDTFSWLLYPLVYSLYIVIRGAWSGFYPYPFIDVTKLGYSSALLNSAGLIMAFWLMSLLLVAVGKFTSPKYSSTV